MQMWPTSGPHDSFYTYFNCTIKWEIKLIKLCVFVSCALTYIHSISWFYSWVAGAMGVKFLAKGNNSSRMPQLGIKPGTFRLPGRCPGSLLLPPLWQLPCLPYTTYLHTCGQLSLSQKNLQGCNIINSPLFFWVCLFVFLRIPLGRHMSIIWPRSLTKELHLTLIDQL